MLSGISAGCLCWFRWGHSDSMSFYRPEDWRYIRVRGMGLIDAIACPHLDSEERVRSFQQMVGGHSDVGVALDDNCALEIVDDKYRVITSQDGAGAHRFLKRSGEISVERIVQREEYEPLASLLGKV